MHIAGYRPNLSECTKSETGFLHQLFNHMVRTEGSEGGGLKIAVWKLREGQERNASNVDAQ